jgi:hypothetical protein
MYLALTGKTSDKAALERAVDDAKALGLALKVYGYNQYVAGLLKDLKGTPNGKANADYIDQAIDALK